MKIKISYEPKEKKEAAAAVVAFLRLHPGSTVRKSDRHAKYLNIYIATQRAEKPCKSGEDVV